MAIKPILFNTEMVRAILDGRKACTRRILKGAIPFGEKVEYWNVLKKGEWSGPICVEDFIKQGSPYKPGDILYVRETWCKGYLMNAKERYYYKADDNYFLCTWHPSIHMPKEAARIWLKVTDVRVERLQEITEEQTEEEGFLFTPPCLHRTGENYCDIDGPCESNTKYCDMSSGELFGKVLWNSTIKKSDLDRYGWEANPYVFVIEFSKVDKPEEVYTPKGDRE